MGKKSGKKSGVEIVSTLPAKRDRKGKSVVDVPAEKPVSAKKQKREPEKVVVVANKNNKKVMKVPRKEPGTGSSEDTSMSGSEEEEITPKTRGGPKKSTQRVGFYRNCLGNVHSRNASQRDSRPLLKLLHAAETLSGAQAPARTPLGSPLPKTSLSSKKLSASSAKNGTAAFSNKKKQKPAVSKSTSAKAPKKTAVSSVSSSEEDSEKEDEGITSKVGAKRNGAFPASKTQKPLSESSESESEESKPDDDSEEIKTKASTGGEKPQPKTAPGPTSKRKIESSHSSDSDSDYDAADVDRCCLLPSSSLPGTPRRRCRFTAALTAAIGPETESSHAVSQPTAHAPSFEAGGESSQPAPKKVRGGFSGIRLNKLTNDGTRKLPIAFIKDRKDILRPIETENSNQLCLWLGKVAREVFLTPLRNWDSLTHEDFRKIHSKIDLYFVFVGDPNDILRFHDFCYNKMTKSLRGWRHSAKKYWQDKWLKVSEEQRRIMPGIAASDWDELITFYETEDHKERSVTNSANRAKSKIVHTTGTTSFSEFEYKQSTVSEDGTRVWPSPADAWMLEHTRKNAEGERVYIDPISSELHAQIADVQATQQTQQSVAVPVVHPTDVVLKQHHNRRTGRGSDFAPLPSSARTRIWRRTSDFNEEQLEQRLQAERERARQELREERESARRALEEQREIARQELQAEREQREGLATRFEAELKSRDEKFERLLVRIGLSNDD